MRGKTFHNTIAKQAKSLLIANGWQVYEEHLCRKGNVTTYLDLFAVKGDCKLACEIETTSRNAKKNMSKAILVDIELWVIVPSRKIRYQINRIKSSMPPEYSKSITILLLSQMQQKLIER